MNKFKPHINPIYPPNNVLIFEEWFDEKYNGCNTDRELLPVFWTSYWVNNDYGKSRQALKELNDLLGQLDKSKKYFSIIQYDDGSMIDWRLFGLDVLEFNMSKQKGVMIPLICMPHPYPPSNEKKYIASFIGGRTHPIRNGLEKYINKKDWYISFEQHNIEEYCKVMSQSIFALCPRGYGANSFRTCEALQYGAIPVYISDEFIEPFNVDFNSYGVKYKAEDIAKLGLFLEHFFPEAEVAKRLEKFPEIYNEYYTYSGLYNNIIKSLEAEYSMREPFRQAATVDEGIADAGDN